MAHTFCRPPDSDPWTAPPRGCVAVPHVCFEREQIILHGSTAAEALPRLMGLLNGTRDPSDVFSRLRPTVRPTVLANPTAGVPYEYLPLAMGAKRVPRTRAKAARFVRRHTPSRPSAFSEETAVAFFTSWSNSFTEIFSRAVVRLYELWCALASGRQRLHLFPAMWGSSWGPDYAHYWLSPFSALPVRPMAATPPRELVKLVWRALVTDEQWARYANESDAMFLRNRRGPQCFRRAFVCDFTGMPWAHRIRPWSAVQMIAAHHGGAAQEARTARVAVPRMRSCGAGGGGGGGGGGAAAAGASAAAAMAAGAASAPSSVSARGRQLLGAGSRRLSAAGAEGDPLRAAERGTRQRGRGCPLRVVFADRKGRRKLSNILELVDECNRWRAPPPHGSLRVNCTAHNFGLGLVASLPVLSVADVLVVSHGADIINGFAMHMGASVVEVMPIHQKGCPCDMYRRMYSYQGPKVLHYHMVSKNASNAVSTEARKIGTYHSDLRLPWPALAPVLAHIVAVGGKRANYKFRRFPY